MTTPSTKMFNAVRLLRQAATWFPYPEMEREFNDAANALEELGLDAMLRELEIEPVVRAHSPVSYTQKIIGFMREGFSELRQGLEQLWHWATIDEVVAVAAILIGLIAFLVLYG